MSQTETTARYSQMSGPDVAKELQNEWDAFYNELPSSLPDDVNQRATKIHTLIDVIGEKVSN